MEIWSKVNICLKTPVAVETRAFLLDFPQCASSCALIEKERREEREARERIFEARVLDPARQIQLRVEQNAY
jgi:hypothetical protein